MVPDAGITYSPTERTGTAHGELERPHVTGPITSLQTLRSLSVGSDGMDRLGPRASAGSLPTVDQSQQPAQHAFL
jgi:hypothetical protein